MELTNIFTFHIVKIKRFVKDTGAGNILKFTFHIVKIKRCSASAV
ncbi:MAG: hypothetical protein ACRDCB_10060 [Clostridium sp.]